MTEHNCKHCGEELHPGDNWYMSHVAKHYYICTTCLKFSTRVLTHIPRAILRETYGLSSAEFEAAGGVSGLDEDGAVRNMVEAMPLHMMAEYLPDRSRQSFIDAGMRQWAHEHGVTLPAGTTAPKFEQIKRDKIHQEAITRAGGLDRWNAASEQLRIQILQEVKQKHRHRARWEAADIPKRPKALAGMVYLNFHPFESYIIPDDGHVDFYIHDIPGILDDKVRHLKVGKETTLEKRLDEANKNTNIRHKVYERLYTSPIFSDVDRAEKLVHERLRAVAEGVDREWFDYTIVGTVSIILAVYDELEGG